MDIDGLYALFQQKVIVDINRHKELLEAIKDMKDHCDSVTSRCHIVNDFTQKRLRECENSIGNIKSIGSIFVIVWTSLVAIASRFIGRWV